MLFPSRIGSEMKNVSDGNTSQKILVDKLLILDTSFVSMYSHNIANTDTSGIEAKNAPRNELRFAISEINTISVVVITNLVM